MGKLPTDQTHKLRIWGVYDILDNERHNLNVSLLQTMTWLRTLFWSPTLRQTLLLTTRAQAPPV